MLNIQLLTKAQNNQPTKFCTWLACLKIFHVLLSLNWSFLLQVTVLITRKEDGGTMHVLTQISMESGIVEDTTAVDIRMVFTGLNFGEDHIH